VLLTPMLIAAHPAQQRATGLKFFFIQRLARMVMIMSLLSARGAASGTMVLVVISGILVLKIGGFPFHQWLISLGRGLSWKALVALLTIQKFVPIFLVRVAGPKPVLRLALLGWPFLVGVRLMAKSLKKILVLSSVFLLLSLLVASSVGG